MQSITKGGQLSIMLYGVKILKLPNICLMQDQSVIVEYLEPLSSAPVRKGVDDTLLPEWQANGDQLPSSIVPTG